jgi:hypothetical protein
MKVIELVSDSCGYNCCIQGTQKCTDAFHGIASFYSRDEWERRRVEGLVEDPREAA